MPKPRIKKHQPKAGRNIFQLLILIVFLAVFTGLLMDKKVNSEQQAINRVKQIYPDLNLPSTSLIQTNVSAEKTDKGWYLNFITPGSGVDVASAQCFLVSDKGQVTRLATYPSDQANPWRRYYDTCRPKTLAIPFVSENQVMKTIYQAEKGLWYSPVMKTIMVATIEEKPTLDNPTFLVHIFEKRPDHNVTINWLRVDAFSGDVECAMFEKGELQPNCP